MKSGQLHAPSTLHPGEKAPWCLPQSRSGRHGEKKNFAPDRNCTLVVQPIAQCYTQ
jgi:hypothetical protein